MSTKTPHQIAAANGPAWEAAGEPNYYPGSQWAKWEDEALRQIEEAW
mgnify:CR=1 FL=1